MNNKPASSTRINALDFTKGALVLFMVAYHSLNYSAEWRLGFRLMAFLPPSFIIITGFILSNIYFSRTNINAATLARRLIVRGVKLILIFTLVNMLAILVNPRIYDGLPLDIATFFFHPLEVYVYGDRSLSAFEILLPIGYLLLLGPVCFLIQRWQPLAMISLTAFALLTCACLEHFAGGFYVAFMFSAGLIGVVLGGIPLANLNRLARFWPIFLVMYGFQAAFLLQWGSPFLMQMLAACFALAIIYGAAVQLGSTGSIQSLIETFGQYSLLSYISQIAFLQILSHLFGLHRPPLLSLGFIILLAGTLALMTACVLLTHVLRRKLLRFDAVYRLVFA